MKIRAGDRVQLKAGGGPRMVVEHVMLGRVAVRCWWRSTAVPGGTPTLEREQIRVKALIRA